MPTLAAGLLALAAAASPAPAPNFLDINPSWSPDGRWLVFQSERHGRTQLYVIGADGNGERRLTRSFGEDTHPAWSPDGEWILFDSNRDGFWNLYLNPPRRDGRKAADRPRCLDRRRVRTASGLVARRTEDRVRFRPGRRRRGLRVRRRRVESSAAHEEPRGRRPPLLDAGRQGDPLHWKARRQPGRLDRVRGGGRSPPPHDGQGCGRGRQGLARREAHRLLQRARGQRGDIPDGPRRVEPPQPHAGRRDRVRARLVSRRELGSPTTPTLREAASRSSSWTPTAATGGR